MKGMQQKVGLLASGLQLRLRQVAMFRQGIHAYAEKHRRTLLAGPLAIQVQTIDQCNASCLMCPYSSSKKSGPPNRMEEGLYQRILSELKKGGTVRLFTPMLQNEPLLDKALDKRVREAKESLGSRASVHVTTNGSLLTMKQAEKLADAGLDYLSVSINAFHEETYRSIHKGLSFSTVTGNVQSFLRQNPQTKVVVRFLKQRANQGEERVFRRFWTAQGALVSFHSVVNRAGMLQSFGEVKRRKSGLLRRLLDSVLDRILPYCPSPFYALNILWDGRVLLCCHDWGHSVHVGNVSTQALSDVWNGEEMNHYRYLLYSSQSKESPACAECSLRNGLRGRRS
jgi:radical SAM protein with 4Fe4S-binding SPASM domain